MANLKDVMIARNVLAKLTKEEIETLEEAMYKEDAILCVDCIHLERPAGRYTWFVPVGSDFDIEIGDILVVNQVVGVGLALVQARTNPYLKTKQEHEMDVHPYCWVIQNLGKQKLNY